jgi:hypothetical protein
MRDINVDGMLHGIPWEEVGLYVDTVDQHYPIGIGFDVHGRRWRYCRAYEAIAVSHWLCPNMALQGGDTGGSVFAIEHEAHAVAYAGERMIDVHATPTYGLDYFYNGLVVIFSTGADPQIMVFRCTGNEVGDAHSIKIYLDHPLPINVTAGAGTGYGISVYPSPYQNVGNGQAHAGIGPAVVNPLCIVASGYYFWGQTKGPSYVVPNVYAYGVNKMLVTDGSIAKATTTDIRQFIGTSYSRSSDGSYDDGAVMLNLEP